MSPHSPLQVMPKKTALTCPSASRCQFVKTNCRPRGATLQFCNPHLKMWTNLVVRFRFVTPPSSQGIVFRLPKLPSLVRRRSDFLFCSLHNTTLSFNCQAMRLTTTFAYNGPHFIKLTLPLLLLAHRGRKLTLNNIFTMKKTAKQNDKHKTKLICFFRNVYI